MDDLSKYIIERIAKDSLNIETLETQKSDKKDFHSIAIWQIKAALIEAYNAGKRFEKENQVISLAQMKCQIDEIITNAYYSCINNS